MNELLHSPAASDPAVLLDALGLWWRTGKLHVLTLRHSFGLYVERGNLLMATSSDRGLRLGQVLVRQGAADLVAMEQLLRAKPQTESVPPLGTRLISGGIIAPSALEDAVEVQVIEVLARILDSNDSTMLSLGDEPIPRGILRFDFDTARLISAAERRHAERAAARALVRLLPSRRTPLRMTVALPEVAHLLNDGELLVALAVQNGADTLERLIDQAPGDQMAVRRAVVALVERGYLATGGPSVSR